MQKQFLKYITPHQLCTKTDKILLAVSGGVDSMVMAHLFISSGYEVGIFTCDHLLRGEESKKDKAFVLENFKDILSYSTDLHVLEYAKKNKLNKQEAARILRYEALVNCATQNQFTHIATAHHANDNVETTLLHLAKKAGLKGLAGIKKINTEYDNVKIIRPLLFATKEEILTFSSWKKIAFREDSSNATDEYKRNFLRNQVIPLFDQINNKFVKNAAESIDFLSEQVGFFDFFLKKIRKEILSEENNYLKINYFLLKNYPAQSSILFEIIKEYGFNTAQCREIISSLENGHNGALWLSIQHRLIIDRGFILIKNISKSNIQNAVNEFLINKENINLITPQGNFTFDFLENTPVTLSDNPNNIFIDVTKTAFPIRLRYWKNGDYFVPLGLGKRKKLQDFFTDLKLNIFQKEEILLLECNEAIAWVVGHRIDERFKINSDSKSILHITYSPTR